MKTHEAGLNETDTALILLDAAGTVLNASTRGHALLAAYHPVRTTDKSLIRIATDVGYASQYSFTTAAAARVRTPHSSTTPRPEIARPMR